MKRIYLDHNATTPLHPAVVQEMVPYFQDVFGNASSPTGSAKRRTRPWTAQGNLSNLTLKKWVEGGFMDL